MSLPTRRDFLAASAATAALLILPARVRARSPRMTLTATSRTIDVQGKAATVWGLRDGNGRSGLVLDPGQAFAVDLTNALDEPTLIHWHGQIPPNAQDGVPGLPMPVLAPGETRAYDFAARPGTHWMHAHIPEHEMRLLAAPLIVRRPEDLATDRQEVTLLLHDFAFKPPAEVLAEITSGTAMAGMAGMAGMDHGQTGQGGMDDMGGMAEGGMDLNDYAFDAYLANDRTLDDPETVTVDKGGRVLVRVINAAAATVFWIDTGILTGRLVAVDGAPVLPLAGSRFGLAMGQRLDIEVDVPGAGGAFPILALREGAAERTGLILATPGAVVTRLAGRSQADHPAFSADLAQEAMLRAVTPLPDTPLPDTPLPDTPLPERPPASQPMLMLGGSMQPYLWTINGRTWGSHAPVTARSGARVEITFHNMSMMAHPMHLHGHAFQVVQIGTRRIAGAVRDTVHVAPMRRVTVAVDAGEAARWMLHCHHLPHLSAGMMTEFVVTA